MIIGNKIYKKEKCFNSIDWAKENINSVSDGAIFLADIHETTRGRQDRIWKFYPEQLIVTFVLKPKNLFDNFEGAIDLRLRQLNMAITLGILEPLKSYNIELKWPNDFMYGDKKVGGLIFDVVWGGNKLLGIIAAFAVNVNNIIEEPDEITSIATSLKQVAGKEIDKKELFDKFLNSLNKFYEKYLNSEFDSIFEQWKKSQSCINTKITVHRRDKSEVTGFFYDVSKNGDLILRDEDGNKNIIPFYAVENIFTSEEL
jgi:BirA family transcriptional regulator, biotin operon repressor / biotin---[acetyl-CoA-carboxylase] ligase